MARNWFSACIPNSRQLVTTEILNCLGVAGEHVELIAGVVEHLLVIRAVAAESGTVAS